MNKVSASCPICGKPMLLVFSTFYKSFACVNKDCLELYEAMEYDIEDFVLDDLMIEENWELDGGNDGSDILETEWSREDDFRNTELET